MSEELIYLKERYADLLKRIKRDQIRFAEDEFHSTIHKLQSKLPQVFLASGGIKLIESLYSYPEELRRLLDARDELMDIEARMKHLRMVEEWSKDQHES